MKIKGEIIAIGDEILIGQTLDTNSRYLASELALIGISLNYISVIHDDKTELTEAFKTAEKRSDLVLITGGLGPTKDDITKVTLCEYFNGKLVLNQERLNELQDIYAKKGKPLNSLNQTQALLPDVCEPLHNAVGTANGMWFERNGKIFISMPGVPYEMKYIFRNVARFKITEYFDTPKIIHRNIRTFGIGESDLAIKIEEWENSLPENFGLAYLPSLASVKLRLSVTVKEEATISQRLENKIQELHSILGKYIYTEGEEEFEAYIAHLLSNKSLTISTAESCTGGYLAHLLTAFPGSSKHFIGSVIAYSNDVKMNDLHVKKETLDAHGAVCEHTVKQMAENVRKKFKTDYALATSGIAGPGGGTEEKPVGTVWIACASERACKAKQFNFARTRDLNIQLSSLYALNMLREEIEGI